MHCIFTHYISNEREFVSLSDDMNNYIIKVSPEKWAKKHFSHFYFLNIDISLNILVIKMKF